MSETQPELTITPVRPEDHARWRELFAGYAAFYEVPLTGADYDRVWSWIQDPARETRCIVARSADGLPVGLAHYREFDAPLRGTSGYLDDLFVDPAYRGGGAADALLVELGRIAAEEGWAAVRWTTAENNYRARAVYDRHATRTVFLTYSMAPQS
ncbi:ribosomal protein S18 acetylase RimI-like enzyme [Streptacidiphilus sp. MAP12-16]|uniref:GNAT family N-acetyltransferase n=1 Tax=Streptacidiphilus sp. MAP12-16 TaxID=3156300 RepID=UPI0035196693